MTEHPQDPAAPEPEPAEGESAAGGWVPEGEGVKAIPDAWVISSGEGDWAPPGDSPTEAFPVAGEDPAPLVPDSELSAPEPPEPEPTVTVPEPEPEPAVPEPEPLLETPAASSEAPAIVPEPEAAQTYTAPPALPEELAPPAVPTSASSPPVPPPPPIAPPLPPPLPPPQTATSGGSRSIVTDRPEIIIAAAFVGGFLLATLIKRLAR